MTELYGFIKRQDGFWWVDSDNTKHSMSDRYGKFVLFVLNVLLKIHSLIIQK